MFLLSGKVKRKSFRHPILMMGKIAPCVLAPVHLIDLGGGVNYLFTLSRSLKTTRSLVAANDLGHQTIRRGYCLMPKRQSFFERNLKKDNQQSRISQAMSNNGVSFYTTYLFTNLFQIHNKVAYTSLVAFKKVKWMMNNCYAYKCYNCL